MGDLLSSGRPREGVGGASLQGLPLGERLGFWPPASHGAQSPLVATGCFVQRCTPQWEPVLREGKQSMWEEVHTRQLRQQERGYWRGHLCPDLGQLHLCPGRTAGATGVSTSTGFTGAGAATGRAPRMSGGGVHCATEGGLLCHLPKPAFG